MLPAGLPGKTVSGSQPWATILCRFQDEGDTQSEAPIAYFEGLMDRMDDYWQETSYSQIDLAGSVVEGWYDMGKPKSDYVETVEEDGKEKKKTKLGGLAEDCTQAAMDAGFDFEGFVGVNLMYNEKPASWSGFGGGVYLDIDSQGNVLWDLTWMPPEGWRHHSILGQEMGHAWGLPHSSGPGTATYDSQWDVMSGGGTCNSPGASIFGCEGVHTISPHKDALGWVPATRKRTLAAGSMLEARLERLSQDPATLPIDPDVLQMVEITLPPFGWPIGDPDPIFEIPFQYYTVESRRWQGFDVNTPDTGVLIHYVNEFLDDRNAQVVTESGDDPNGDEAIWTAGEVFVDDVNGVALCVENHDTTGADIVIRNDIVNSPPVADAGGPYEVDEGSELSMDGSSSSDPDACDTLTYSWTDGTDYTLEDGDSAAPTFTSVIDGAHTVPLTVSDAFGGEDQDSADVTVHNVAPTVSSITIVPAGLVSLGDEITTSATFEDPAGAEDAPFTATWDWDGFGGEPAEAGTITQPVVGSKKGSVEDTHTYCQPGSYTIRLRVRDKDGGLGAAQPAQVTVDLTPTGDGILQTDIELTFLTWTGAVPSTISAAKQAWRSGVGVADHWWIYEDTEGEWLYFLFGRPYLSSSYIKGATPDIHGAFLAVAVPKESFQSWFWCGIPLYGPGPFGRFTGYGCHPQYGPDGELHPWVQARIAKSQDAVAEIFDSAFCP